MRRASTTASLLLDGINLLGVDLNYLLQRVRLFEVAGDSCILRPKTFAFCAIPSNAFDESDKEELGTCASDNTAKRQMKKNDSGASDENVKRKKMNDNETEVDGEGDSGMLPESSETPRTSEAPSEKGDGFPKVAANFKKRNYRKHGVPGDDKASLEEAQSPAQNTDTDMETGSTAQSSSVSLDNSDSNPGCGTADGDSSNLPETVKSWTVYARKNLEDTVSHDDTTRSAEGRRASTSSTSSSSDTSSTSILFDGKLDADGNTEAEDPAGNVKPAVLFKQKPKHKWFLIPEIVTRQYGCPSRKQGTELFQQRMYGSLHSVQRLELMYKLEHHQGCVNTLNFNQSGTLLASGSDDLRICLWNWPVGKLLHSFDSGHKGNVFQAKFLPLIGETYMATCARDGQVRIIELGPCGKPRENRKVGQHRGVAHRLATQNEVPHVFLSCGEDALVLNVDVRMPKSETVMYLREKGKKVSLYSINSNPMNQHEFVISGFEKFVRLYDRRNTSEAVKKFCPQHLYVSDTSVHVTCAVFNYNGTEILASYNDEDIYLFDVKAADGCEFIHRYQGHRNNATVKGVNFFGPKSEFIVSGSDCGNLFFWERETESIVQWMLGDENGVVNCLEPHPQIPILATSGLDEDVKIWVPSCEQEPSLNGLEKTVVTNLRNRDADRGVSDAADGQMLWILWRHIRRAEHMTLGNYSFASRRSGNTDSNADIILHTSTDSSVSSDADQDDDEEGNHLPCAPS